jgi:hypothetical protein
LLRNIDPHPLDTPCKLHQNGEGDKPKKYGRDTKMAKLKGNGKTEKRQQLFYHIYGVYVHIYVDI